MCDEDLQCGGFTYKGSLLMGKPYQIYFFHLLINIETDLDSVKWTMYKANRTFITFPGVFQKKGAPKKWTIVSKNKQYDPETKCEQLWNDCVGIEKYKNSTISVLLDYIDLDSFKLSKYKVTLVKLDDADGDTKIIGKSSWDLSHINFCCPENALVDIQSLHDEIHDSLPRVSCDIPKEQFLAEYVRKQKPAILVNCTKDWPAQKTWTFKRFLKDGDGLSLWRTDFIDNHNFFQTFGQKEFISGNQIESIIKNNGTVRLFEVLGRRRLWKSSRERNTDENSKSRLLEDYSTPHPIPEDMYKLSGVQTDYQWMIMSQANTGTSLHLDPEYTMAWNTVLSGRKWWVLMPPELSPSLFSCDSSCSKTKEGDISILSWFKHILPQLRGKKWYGNTVREFIQGPGETLYMPANMAHAIMNVEDNMSVTENYFLVDGLEDYIHGVMAGDIVVEKDSLCEEIFWKSLYFQQLGREEREVARSMMKQVEERLNADPGMCEKY